MVQDQLRAGEYHRKHIHFVGIKGTGVLGLATVLYDMGAIITGSDVADTFVTDSVLTDLGLTALPFSVHNITKDISLVIHSTAYNDDHEEIARARELQIPTETYTEALARMVNDHRSIVVTGSHGKTTTSAMIATMLVDAGKDPTAIIGGMVSAWHRTARHGASDLMVVEGDEYQKKILSYRAYIAVITNVEWDHPDFFHNAAEYIDMFETFIKGLSSDATLVISPDAARMLKDAIAMTKATVMEYESIDVPLHVLGAHNAMNAGAALAVATALGLDETLAKKSLSRFQGTKRRMEYYSDPEAERVLMDDFAHHPSEVVATLSALLARYPQRHITAVFQAHTYTRTRTFLYEFARAFRDANAVIVLPIFASAREVSTVITTSELTRAIARNHSNVREVRSIEEAVSIIRSEEKTPSVIVALGAGEQWRVVNALRAS